MSVGDLPSSLSLHFLAHPWALWVLLAPLVLAVLGGVARWRRRKAVDRFGRPLALLPLLPPRPRFRWLPAASYLLGVLLLVAAAAGPRWGPDPDQPAAPGRDLVVVLDLSRSMLAQDVLPSRWERCRDSLYQLAAVMQERGGHRVGLVVFAGKAKVLCPLTRDYDHFRAVLAELDPRQFGPELRDPVAASGTRLGAGVRAAVAACDANFPGFEDVLMMSDGDDPAGDTEWLAGIADARRAGVPVHCVGVGDPDHDWPVPLPEGGYLESDRVRVTTRLNQEPLREIARQTDAAYLAAGRDPPALADFFRARIEPRPGRDLREDLLPLPKDRGEWFLGPALACLMIAFLMEDRGRRRPRPRGDDDDGPTPAAGAAARRAERRPAGR
jgi:Ca-activated chloride channel family protein